MWTLRDLTARDGGALRSLYRAYRATTFLEATYELFLEFPVSPRSSIHGLATSSAQQVSQLVNDVAKALKIDEHEARTFMARVRLRGPLPGRSHVDAVNRSLLLANATVVSASDVERIYQRALNKIESAMRAEPTSIPWPQYLALGDRGAAEAKLAAKTMSREVCKDLFGELKRPASRLLRKTVDPSIPRPTRLESKLVLGGGGTDAIIDSAIRLRANASTAAYEAACTSEPRPSAELEDLRERLYHRVTAIVEKHRTAEAPASAIWEEVMAVSATEAAALDPNGVAERDQMLIVGHVCELSDECRTTWGGPDA